MIVHVPGSPAVVYSSLVAQEAIGSGLQLVHRLITPAWCSLWQARWHEDIVAQGNARSWQHPEVQIIWGMWILKG